MFGRSVRLLLCLLPVLPCVGCGRRAAPPTETAKPIVAVVRPVSREVTDYEEFTGRTDAPESVDVKARVTGYLTKITFKSGDEIKTGDQLFEIDPRPYKADLDRAVSQVALADARLKLAEANNARAKKVAETPGAISQQELDVRAAEQAEAKAALDAAKANVESYKLNYEFCRITAPVNGRTSRNLLTLGNLVNKDETLLTTIVSEDPMYGYFDVDENTMLRVIRGTAEGHVAPARSGKAPVELAVADEKEFPHRGTIDFINNQVDPLTGTITVRGTFANPQQGNGVRLLRPGMFVRIRLPISKPHPALLVPEQALGTDQGQKFLYVVDDDNVIQYHRVKLGAQQEGLRVIEEGVKAGERVVVSGLQQVRPRMEVEVEEEKAASN